MNYWKKREEEAKKHYLTEEAEIRKSLERRYNLLLTDIEKEIYGFYAKYARDEGLTMAEAQKAVDKMDVQAFADKARRYVKTRDFSAKANAELKLYNATMKINRLELLKANIGLELIDAFNEIDAELRDAFENRAMEEFNRQAGILGDSVKRSTKNAKSIVNASFHHATFSERIWMYQAQLKHALDDLLTNGIVQGYNPRVLARDLVKAFGASRANAERLMRTEMARVQTEAQKQSFDTNGFDQYMFLALGNACDICKAIDGEVFNVNDMMPGENAPPMHPNCRCSTAAYMDRASVEREIFGAEESYRAKTIKTEKDLQKMSNSPIVLMDTLDEIVLYFDSQYRIEIQDFQGQDLLKVKATLAGYDDFFTAFPEAGKLTKSIMFSPNFADDGKMSSDGFSVVGPSGLAYGTGLHEAAHALDYAKSFPELHTFSNAVLMQAIREAGIEVYKRNIDQIIGSLFLDEKKIAEILSDPSELYAYSMETALGGGNEFADILLKVARRYNEKFV